MARSRDISKVLSSNSTLATDAEVSAFNYLTQSSASTVYQTKAAAGLTLIIPTSIATTGGSGSISSTGTVSFTSASAISLNGAFSSAYDNYRILFTLDSNSVPGEINFKMRVGGVDNSASQYVSRGVQSTGSVSGISVSSTYGRLLTNYYTELVGLSWEIFTPFLSKKARWNSQSYGSDVTGAVVTYIVSGAHEVQSSFDGVSVYPASGTFTGTVSVYGYNK